MIIIINPFWVRLRYKYQAWGAIELAKSSYNFTVGVNWLGINEEELRLQFNKITSSRKLVYKHNPFEVPRRLWHFILNKLKISEDQIWGDFKKKSINKLINTLLNDKFEVKGKTTFKEEFVSCGGIDLSRITIK